MYQRVTRKPRLALRTLQLSTVTAWKIQQRVRIATDAFNIAFDKLRFDAILFLV